VVRLEHPDDLLDKLAYLIANPVAAGLVKDPRDWPGVMTTGLGETLVAERPAVFFRRKSSMPERAKLVCTLAPALRHLGLDAAARRLRAAARESVRRAKHSIRAQGRDFLGADAVRAMPTHRRATTPESMRRRTPSLTSRDATRRETAIRQLRVFRAAYRIAFECWRTGRRTVRFPEGTYQLRVVHAVCCGPPPLS
jgi:putative transposase